LIFIIYPFQNKRKTRWCLA